MTFPLLFLDIDGVLNTWPWRAGRVDRHLVHDRMTTSDLAAAARTELDPALCAELAEVLLRTDARVVLSSTWRRLCSVVDVELMLEAAAASFDPALAMLVGSDPIPRLASLRDDVARARAAGEAVGYPFLGRLVSTTPTTGRRAEEIETWLLQNPESWDPSRIAIVDDADLSSLPPERFERFVRTDDDRGLGSSESARLRALLRGAA